MGIKFLWFYGYFPKSSTKFTTSLKKHNHFSTTDNFRINSNIIKSAMFYMCKCSTGQYSTLNRQATNSILIIASSKPKRISGFCWVYWTVHCFKRVKKIKQKVEYPT
jgi:hypothetical protein